MDAKMKKWMIGIGIVGVLMIIILGAIFNAPRPVVKSIEDYAAKYKDDAKVVAETAHKVLDAMKHAGDKEWVKKCFADAECVQYLDNVVHPFQYQTADGEWHDKHFYYSFSAHTWVDESREQRCKENEKCAPLLSEPLVSVKGKNGWIKAKLDDEICFVRLTLARQLEAINEENLNETEKDLLINLCWRPAEEQAVLYAKMVVLPRQNPKKWGGVLRCAYPADSFHGLGLAVDFQSFMGIADALYFNGWQGGCHGMEDDMGHFSVGELSRRSDGQAFISCTKVLINYTIHHPIKAVGKAAKAIEKNKDNIRHPIKWWKNRGKKHK